MTQVCGGKQGQYSGRFPFDLIWVKLVLAFYSLSYSFFSPVEGEGTLGFPGRGAGTWIRAEACGKLASACLLFCLLLRNIYDH